MSDYKKKTLWERLARRYHKRMRRIKQRVLISQRGMWRSKNPQSPTCAHQFDRPLAEALARMCQQTEVVDLGCGPGEYVRLLRSHDIPCQGYDGNPHTRRLTNGLCDVLDLSKPIALDRDFDWVISLEVGEHIPSRYESIFIENITHHARHGLVLSWAVPGQGGDGHVNERTNEYIEGKLLERQFARDRTTEQHLRDTAVLHWFKNSLMVYHRTA